MEEQNMHKCPNCDRKVPDWEWDEGEGMCDTCVAEDTHAARGFLWRKEKKQRVNPL